MTFPLDRRREWMILIPAMTLPFIASIFYFNVFSDHPIAAFLYAATKIFTFAWPLLGAYLFVKAWIPSFKIKDSVHRKAIPMGIISGLFIVGVMILGMQGEIGNVLYEHADVIRNKAIEMGFYDNFIPFAIFLSFFHSLLEEYYWRWFVYGNLSELMPKVLASILAAAAFASHHVVVLNEYFPFKWALFFGASVMVGGLLWNLMYERQRTLAGAWISHMIVDLGIMTIGYLVIFNQ